ncbi:MAG TPA: hypothetical protein EYG80_02590 [Flavobacteriaceae bacterium]|nr:hypothetical protein [Flavobacteriaceae bacterium]
MKCKSCNFRTYRVLGDVRLDINQLKPCPVCKKTLGIHNINNLNFIEKLLAEVGSSLDKIIKK